MHEHLISMRNIGVAYQGDITILEGVNLDFAAGKVTGLIGPNGAGKSTVLKTLYGFLKLRTGEIEMQGKKISALPPYERINLGIAYVPQHRSVFEDLSVEDNLRLGCWPFRRNKTRIRSAFELAYAFFPILAEKAKDRAGGLSGGQQRFLELARALIVEPKVILMDEPTAMIAPKLSHQIYEFITKLSQDGTTIILVDQNIRQCAAVSDHIFVLELGKNKLSGSRQEFAQDGRLREMIGEWLDYQFD